MKSWYTIRARASGTEVLIYDEIGAYGVSAKGFLAELGALPDDAAIDLRLNSPGGSVFDAVAIFNALKRHTGEVTVWIDGIAASAASYVAMAGDTIIMPENAFLMIHDPSGLVMGTAEDMRSTAEALDKVKGSLIQGYAAKSGKPDADIAALMAAETWLDAKDALDLGLIDRIAEPVRLAATFDVTRLFRNAPQEVVGAAVETTMPSNSPDGGDDPDECEPGDGASGEVEAAGEKTEGAASPVNTPAADTVTKTVTPPSQINEGAGAADAITGDRRVPAAITARAEVLSHARAVIDLCRLAGQPQMAGRFLEEDIGLEDVRARLLAVKAAATPDITAAHAQPGRGATTNTWGDVIARTFKTKG